MKKERNFREVGNSKRLYRSCYLGRMNASELLELKELGIKTILDLRTSYEAYEDPDPDLGINYYRVSGMRDKNGEGVDYSPIGYSKMSVGPNENLDEYLKQLNIEMMFNNEAFKFLLELAKSGKHHFPLVMHCASGKDRTGALAILIYLLLGREIEFIMKDYLTSNIAYQERIEKALNDDPEPNQVESIMMKYGVSEKLGREMIEEILERYSNLDEFFLKEYGINRQSKQKFKELFDI